MSDRNKFIVLLVLVGIFLAVNLRDYLFPAPASTSVVARPQARGKPSARIPDADLNLAALDSSAEVDPQQASRNIFQYGQIARPVVKVKNPEPVVDTPPPPPPPPPPPVRFFGIAEGGAGGGQRLFLTNGEETFIVRVGDVFMRRYRVVRVGTNNANVEIEEIGGANRWTVPREQQ